MSATARHRQQPKLRIGPLSVVLAVTYGLLASYVFCFSGSFGSLGDNLWRDTALIVVTLTAAVALSYITLLLRVYTFRPRDRPGDPEDFSWHLMIPCRDEENVIGATVSTARTTFPHCHVWVIDDDSEDGTARVVKGLMVVDNKIHLVSRVRPEARTGKGDALNAAFRQVSEYIGSDPDLRRRAVVGVLDADGYLSDNTLELLAGADAFGNPEIGAVQIEVWMKNRHDRKPRAGAGRVRNAVGRYLIRMQDLEFRSSNSAMQLLRVHTGTVGMGGNGQFTRLSVLEDVAENYGRPWGGSLSEDYELGLRILALNHTNHYVREAHVSQEALPYFRRLLTQRTRWAQGILQCSALLSMLRRSKALPVMGLLEIHYFMSLPWIMITNLAFVPLLLVFSLMTGEAGFLSGSSNWLVALAGFVFLVAPYALWGFLYRSRGQENVGRAHAAALGLGFLVYVYFTYLYYPRAIARMVTGRNSWAKTRRNADDRSIVSLADAISVFQLSRVPVLDTRMLADLAEELESLVYAHEVVSAFILRWPARLENLNAAIATESGIRCYDAIASIRVASAMVGAPQLEKAAETVSELLTAENYDGARSALPAIETIAEHTIVEMRVNYLGKGSA